jgi:hypothetical protein
VCRHCFEDEIVTPAFASAGSNLCTLTTAATPFSRASVARVFPRASTADLTLSTTREKFASLTRSSPFRAGSVAQGSLYSESSLRGPNLVVV